jgi:hypothetical protein
MTENCSVFVRNDDVDVFQPGLEEVTHIFVERSLPVDHAVVPLRLSADVASWLLGLAGSGVEIIQHGFAHQRYEKGEFGGTRSYDAQLQDMRAGKLILQERFGSQFFPAFSFPYGDHNSASIRALNELGYKLVSSSVGTSHKRRILNGIGRLLGLDVLVGRHVSYHGGTIPNTNLVEVSISISPTTGYVGEYPSLVCSYATLEDLQMRFIQCRKHTSIIGILLHHRYHANSENLDLLARFVDWISRIQDVRFCTIGEIYHHLRAESGEEQ